VIIICRVHAFISFATEDTYLQLMNVKVKVGGCMPTFQEPKMLRDLRCSRRWWFKSPRSRAGFTHFSTSPPIVLPLLLPVPTSILISRHDALHPWRWREHVFETLVTYRNTTQHCNPEDLDLNRKYFHFCFLHIVSTVGRAIVFTVHRM